MRPATLAAFLFVSLVAFGHLLRLLFRVPLIIAGREIPMWASLLAVFVLGAIACGLWLEHRR